MPFQKKIALATWYYLYTHFSINMLILVVSISI